MADYCDVQVTGRLISAPEGGTTHSGEPVTSFRLVFAGRDTFAPVFWVRAFGDVALRAAHFEAGQRVRVSGALSLASRPGRGGGETVRLSVRATAIDLLPAHEVTK